MVLSAWKAFDSYKQGCLLYMMLQHFNRNRLGRYFPIKNLIIPLVERLVAHWVATN